MRTPLQRDRRGWKASWTATLALVGGLALPGPGRPPPHALAAGLRASAEGAYRAELFEQVSRALRSGYYDRDFRSERLPALEREYRVLAEACGSAQEEREVVRRFLSRIPSSHLALYSRRTHDVLLAELACDPHPTLGFQLTRLGDGFFVDRVLEGGPAEQWGLRRGDRVIEIEGLAPADSPRLDWTSDDAALPDPQLHGLLCASGDEVELLVERSPGQRSRGVVVARDYSGCEAARASARVLRGESTTDDGERGERGARVEPASMGYVHLWFIAAGASGDLLGELIHGAFADCDGLILDLRGRGGSASEAARLTGLLARDGPWGRPVVLLTDRGTRSAKEVIAYRMQQDGDAFVVGERSAGAVVPASFRGVGGGAVLMFPRSTLGHYTRALEGRGVEPDLEVADRLPFAAGDDPVLAAGRAFLDAWLETLREDG